MGYGCNNINEGFEPKFCQNLWKEQKKDLHLRNTQLPVFSATVWRDKLFFTNLYVNVRNRFFRKIFHTASGSLKCASGLLSDPRVSGSPPLAYNLRSNYQESVFFFLLLKWGTPLQETPRNKNRNTGHTLT